MYLIYCISIWWSLRPEPSKSQFSATALSASSERKEFQEPRYAKFSSWRPGYTVRGTESRLMVSTKLRNHALPSYAEGFRVSST